MVLYGLYGFVWYGMVQYGIVWHSKDRVCPHITCEGQQAIDRYMCSETDIRDSKDLYGMAVSDGGCGH